MQNKMKTDKENHTFEAQEDNEIVVDETTYKISQSDDLIVFIVGGTKYQVMKLNFAHWPTTKLSRLVRAECTEDILNLCDNFHVCPKSEQYVYTFYRNWTHFNLILDM